MVETMKKYVPTNERYISVQYLTPLYRTPNGYVCLVLYVDARKEAHVTLREKEIEAHFAPINQAPKWPELKGKDR